jgi:hypothetical protein
MQLLVILLSADLFPNFVLTEKKVVFTKSVYRIGVKVTVSCRAPLYLLVEAFPYTLFNKTSRICDISLFSVNS